MVCKNLQGITLLTQKYEASFLVTSKGKAKSVKPKSLQGGREGGGETAESHTKDSEPETAVNCVLQYSQPTVRATDREGRKACSLARKL